MSARFFLLIFSVSVCAGVFLPLSAQLFPAALFLFIAVSIIIPLLSRFRKQRPQSDGPNYAFPAASASNSTTVPFLIIPLAAGIIASAGLAIGFSAVSAVDSEAAALPRKGFARAWFTVTSMPELMPDGRYTVTAGGFRIISSNAGGLYRGQKVLAYGTVYPSGAAHVKPAFYLAGIEDSVEGPLFYRAAAGFRISVQEMIKLRAPAGTRALMFGMLTGNARYMDYASSETFRMTGLTHLLAVSGLNVAIIGAGMLVLLSLLLPLRAASIISVLAVVIYTAACGFEPSALRAGLMFSVFVLTRAFGRPISLLDAMVWSSAFTLAINPLDAQSLGFWLSYMAVLGLYFLSPVISGYLSFLPRILSDSLSVTLAANLATLPLLLVFFQGVSLISPLSNLLVLPLFNFLTVGLFLEFGSLAAGLDAFSGPLGFLNGALWFVCRFIADILSFVPGAYRDTGGLPSWLAPAVSVSLPLLLVLVPRCFIRFNNNGKVLPDH